MRWQEWIIGLVYSYIFKGKISFLSLNYHKSSFSVPKLCKMLWFSFLCLFPSILVLRVLTRCWCGIWFGLIYFILKNMYMWQGLIALLAHVKKKKIIFYSLDLHSFHSWNLFHYETPTSTAQLATKISKITSMS